MENDPLKSIWKEIETPQKDIVALSSMLKEKNQPILKAIKKQASFELLAFTVFLFCYYTMFDGGEKPPLANIALVFTISINIFHHFKGYRLQQLFRSSENILEDLKRFVGKLNSYRLETIIAKSLFIGGMGTFFTTGIPFTVNKWWAIGLILIIFTIQLVFLNRVWANRIRKIKATIGEFENA